MKANMSSKERVLTVFASQQPDRVPVNYFAGEVLDRRLKDHFGLRPDDHEGLFQALGVDFRRMITPYIGPKLHPDIPERGIVSDHFGIRRRWIEHEGGGYWDFCDFPLQHATEEEVANWPLPKPEHFDYSKVQETCRGWKNYAVAAGFPGTCDIINKNGQLRTMEQTLVDLLTDEPAGLLLARRRNELDLEVIRRTLEVAQGGIDYLWIGEDLGTQIAPLISMGLFRKAIKPVLRRFVELAASFNIPTMVHSCGYSSWAFEDFIEIGVKVVDTLQPEVVNMAPAHLKKTFGGRLAFHGCISTAGPLAYGSEQEVVAYCRKTLEIMMPGGGYAFAPTHEIQDNSPIENVLAMYSTARQCGSYHPL